MSLLYGILIAYIQNPKREKECLWTKVLQSENYVKKNKSV